MEAVGRERRKDARKALREGGPVGGAFYVEDNKKAYEIKYIRDVSLTGAGVRVMKSFKTGDQVNFKFESQENLVTVPGTVMWCERNLSTRSCSVGLKFDPADKASNILLLMTLRKLIDFSSAARQ
ncbi:PilZ domain-containing protein [Salinisphaera sp. LB1]|uniref:PilZ domain-containing protein n=1 Tax=Salinisphaera sp. LB1 TaxID=2183911 RepID=UPI000D706CF2|nr:PilZ domain-containing protein [Salinisphaera sp. LB1]